MMNMDEIMIDASDIDEGLKIEADLEIDGITYDPYQNLFIGEMVSVKGSYGCLDYEDHDELCPGTTDMWIFNEDEHYDIDRWVETGAWFLITEK